MTDFCIHDILWWRTGRLCSVLCAVLIGMLANAGYSSRAVAQQPEVEIVGPDSIPLGMPLHVTLEFSATSSNNARYRFIWSETGEAEWVSEPDTVFSYDSVGDKTIRGSVQINGRTYDAPAHTIHVHDQPVRSVASVTPGSTDPPGPSEPTSVPWWLWALVLALLIQILSDAVNRFPDFRTPAPDISIRANDERSSAGVRGGREAVGSEFTLSFRTRPEKNTSPIRLVNDSVEYEVLESSPAQVKQGAPDPTPSSSR